MREVLRFPGKIMSATVSRVADCWFVSLCMDVPEQILPTVAKNQGVVGVDLGISALATLSTGEVIPGPKAHKQLLHRLKRLSRGLSKKQKGSGNRKKMQIKLGRLHARIANIRKDALHKLTSDITSRFDTIGIEALNVSGMMKHRYLARSIADMGFHEFRRQVEYKAERRGNRVIVADRWFASSKICSCCGYKMDVLTLSVRDWLCPVCHVQHNRDYNAAVNLKNMAVSSTVSACGEEGAGLGCKTKVKPASGKQEVNAITTYG
jgi:putative transposase